MLLPPLSDSFPVGARVAAPADSRSSSLTGSGTVVPWSESHLPSDFKRLVARRTRLVSFPCTAGEVRYIVHIKDLKRV